MPIWRASELVVSEPPNVMVLVPMVAVGAVPPEAVFALRIVVTPEGRPLALLSWMKPP